MKASLWRMGQLKSGDTIQYRRVSLKDALRARAELEQFMESVSALVAGQCNMDSIKPIFASTLPESTVSGNWGKALIYETELIEGGISMTFRQVSDRSGYYNHQFLTAADRVGMSSCWSSSAMENSILIIAAV